MEWIITAFKTTIRNRKVFLIIPKLSKQSRKPDHPTAQTFVPLTPLGVWPIKGVVCDISVPEPHCSHFGRDRHVFLYVYDHLSTKLLVSRGQKPHLFLYSQALSNT